MPTLARITTIPSKGTISARTPAGPQRQREAEHQIRIALAIRTAPPILVTPEALCSRGGHICAALANPQLRVYAAPAMRGLATVLLVVAALIGHFVGPGRRGV